MSQKINPFLFRVILNKNWNASWFANRKDFSESLIEDIEIRNFLEKKISNIPHGKLIIQKSINFMYITIFLKKKSPEFKKSKLKSKKLGEEMTKIFSKNIIIIFKKIKNPDTDVFLILYKIKKKIKERKSLKIVMREIFMKCFKKKALGIKVVVKGRINGSVMSKKLIFKEGNMPLQRISSDVRYHSDSILTNYGIIGIKVWIYLGGNFYVNF